MQKPLITALTTLLLASCATTPTPQATQTARPDSIITIPTTTATSNATLEQQYGGTIALRTDTFAIIANPTRQPLTAQGGKQHSVEKNKDTVNVNPSADSPDSTWTNFRYIWSTARYIWSDSQYVWNESKFTNMPENTDIWHNLGVDYAYENTQLGKDKTIAIIDSGVDLTHPMFDGIFVSESKFKDFVDGDAIPEDKGLDGKNGSGHGTGVLGIAVQIAPKARYLPIRVINEAGRGDLLNLAKAIVWAADNNADVINLSLGSSESSEALDLAISYANNRGSIIVAAAGNSNQSVPDFPAAQFENDDMNISVGSVDTYGNKSTFSSYGSSVSLMAPGENIQSAYPNNMTAMFSGTSMSTPIAASAVAIGLSTGLSPEQAIQKLKLTADNIFSADQNYAYVGALGYGKLNIKKYISESPSQ